MIVRNNKYRVNSLDILLLVVMPDVLRLLRMLIKIVKKFISLIKKNNINDSVKANTAIEISS